MNIEGLISQLKDRLGTPEAPFSEFRRPQLELLESQTWAQDSESYKFTSLEKFLPDLPLARSADAYRFQSELPAGVILHDLNGSIPEEVRALLKQTQFTHLHGALLSEAMVLEVEKGVALESPLSLAHLRPEGFSATLLVIWARENSRFTILEQAEGGGVAASFSETYVTLAAGASVEHVFLGIGGQGSIRHTSVFAEVTRDATFRSFFFHVSGSVSRSNLQLSLSAPGAHGESYALYLTNGNEHSDVNTEFLHRSPDTTSNQLAKGILDGESRGIFTGKIHIFPKAQRVASAQLNKNLLLSKRAQAHSQPQLEIFADDVKCSHGSTTGQLSAEELFYFESRGIPEERARVLLAHGFTLEVVLKIANTEARELVSALILKELRTKFELGGMA